MNGCCKMPRPSGQLALRRELQPKQKAKAKAAASKASSRSSVAKRRSKGEAAAKAEAAPDVNVQDTYSMRRHKRKTKDGCCIHAFAIYSNKEQRQMTQLTDTARDDAESIIEGHVSTLNSGKTTIEDVISKLNAMKSAA